MGLPYSKLKPAAVPFPAARPATTENSGALRDNAAFGLLILLYGLEFIGATNHLPVLKALHFNVLLSIALGAAVLFAGGFRSITRHRLAVLLIILICFTFVGISYSVVKTKTFSTFRGHLGYFILFACLYQFISTEKKLRLFLIAALATDFIIILLNIGQLTSGMRAGQIDAAYFLGDGNDFAWSLAIVLPFALYFILNRGIFSKVWGIIAAPPLLFGIVMTMSRGAFLAVLGSFLYFALWTRRKIATIIVLAVIALGTVLCAPHLFWNRMDPSNYMEGSSASGRLQAWKAATQMAIDHPLGVGAGNFQSVYGRFYVERFSGPIEWAARRWISPHSIYFSMLAEYGFLGMVLLLAIIGEMLRVNWKLRKLPGAGLFPACLSMSIVAFSIGGMFLGGIKYPHMYILGGLTLACLNIYGDKNAARPRQ